jgi:hypothetical protein
MYDKDVYTRCPCCKEELLVVLRINDSFANAEIKEVRKPCSSLSEKNRPSEKP